MHNTAVLTYVDDPNAAAGLVDSLGRARVLLHVVPLHDPAEDAFADHVRVQSRQQLVGDRRVAAHRSGDDSLRDVAVHSLILREDHGPRAHQPVDRCVLRERDEVEVRGVAQVALLQVRQVERVPLDVIHSAHDALGQAQDSSDLDLPVFHTVVQSVPPVVARLLLETYTEKAGTATVRVSCPINLNVPAHAAPQHSRRQVLRVALRQVLLALQVHPQIVVVTS